MERSGLYIHIPYCRKACYYCDFHFSTSLQSKQQFVQALCKEIELQADLLKNFKIETIYFGGGTPSLLSLTELSRILEQIYTFYQIGENIEVSLEANPEDVNESSALAWSRAGINRLSLGVQTFDDEILKKLNRNHDSNASKSAIACIQKHFDNYSIDLIHGYPQDDSNHILRDDLQHITAFQPPHVSIYTLTIEERTVLGNWLQKGKWKPLEEEKTADQYQEIINALISAQYEHYEISNFCKPGYHSRHNTAYWLDVPFLGFGPAAFSYLDQKRWYNVKNNAGYIKELSQGSIPIVSESMELSELGADYLIASLRTRWGCDTIRLKEKFQMDVLADKELAIDHLKGRGLLEQEGQYLRLTAQGKFFADHVASELMY